jgi:hypothetical protein
MEKVTLAAWASRLFHQNFSLYLGKVKVTQKSAKNLDVSFHPLVQGVSSASNLEKVSNAFSGHYVLLCSI